MILTRYFSWTTCAPSWVGYLGRPIEIGMSLTRLPFWKICMWWELPSALATHASWMPNDTVRSFLPNTPLPRSTPNSFASSVTLVPAGQYAIGRQCTSREEYHRHAPASGGAGAAPRGPPPAGPGGGVSSEGT